MNAEHQQQQQQPHLLAVAAYHNKVGAQSLTFGNDNQALRYFQSALNHMSLAAKLMRQKSAAAHSGAPAMKQSDTATSGSSYSASSSEAMRRPASDDATSSSSVSASPTTSSTSKGQCERLNAFRSCHDHDEEKNPVSIYKNAMTFKVEDIRTLEDARFCWSIVEFNLALAWHRLSKQMGERALCQALALYDACLNHTANNTNSVVSLNLLMAALNNKASILAEFQDMKTAVQVAEVLLTVINAARDCPPVLLLSVVDISRFRLNVDVLKNMNLAAVA